MTLISLSIITFIFKEEKFNTSPKNEPKMDEEFKQMDETNDGINDDLDLN